MGQLARQPNAYGKKPYFATCSGVICVAIGCLSNVAALFSQELNRPYNLPAVDINERVLWGSTCEPGEGLGLSFGGEDQQADDGCSHTRILRSGKWVDIRSELEKLNPWQDAVASLRRIDDQCELIEAQMRSSYISNDSPQKKQDLQERLVRDVKNVMDNLASLHKQFTESLSAAQPESYAANQGEYALSHLRTAHLEARALVKRSSLPSTGDLFSMQILRLELQLAADAFDCEPPARALSPLCYHEASKVYFLFGGDHLDYLTNDLWMFDPAVPQWRQLHPAYCPEPRANHHLAVDKEGKITVTGGYTYTSNTDYVGGQYCDWNDGTWIYDLTSNKWTGSGLKTMSAKRTYRKVPFVPEFFWRGDRPDQPAFQAKLAQLPVNTWTKLEIPYLPEMNRDWGTAIYDPTHDLILRFSGGHSAHGGTDVLHFHLQSGRWELPNAVEFPLGQLYSNTSYPAGFNFNRRPWVTGHTYKSYGYDEASQRMLFVGEQKYTYLYDPVRGDWTGERVEKPKEMQYEGCFYDLTLCPTEHGTFCWTKDGQLFRWEKTEPAKGDIWQWKAIELKGEKLPGTVVDRSGFVYDSQRERFLCTTKPYEGPFDGQVYAIDVKSGEVTNLNASNSNAMREVGFLREGVYVPELDLVLLGVNFPIQEGTTRRTPAFDCKSNRWIYLELGGEDPSGREGSNVSLGLIYDPARKLIWGVDTHSHVYVLRLEAKSLTKHALSD